MADFFSVLSKAVQTGDGNQVVQTVNEALKGGTPATELLEKGLVPGVQALGKLF